MLASAMSTSKPSRALTRLALLLFALAMANTAGAETITTRADLWCPYNCGPKDSAPGILVELMQIAFVNSTTKLDYATMPWTQAVADVRSGRFDSAVGIAGPDAVGTAHSDKPQLISITCAYALLASRKAVKTARDLKKLSSIGVIKDYSYGEKTDQVLAEMVARKKVSVVATDDALTVNIRRLNDGKIEALIEDIRVMDYQLRIRKLTHIKKIGCTEDRGPIWIGFTASNPKSKGWIETLVRTQTELEKSGKMAEIYRRYGVEETSAKP